MGFRVDCRRYFRIVGDPEQGAERDAFCDANRTLISSVTLYETMIVARARLGPGGLDDLAELIDTVGLEILPFDGAQAAAAHDAYLHFGKGNHASAALNLCDCVAYAVAKSMNAPLLFKGLDFAATDVLNAAAASAAGQSSGPES